MHDSGGESEKSMKPQKWCIHTYSTLILYNKQYINCGENTGYIQGNSRWEVSKVKPDNCKPPHDQSTNIHTYVANYIAPCAN